MANLPAAGEPAGPAAGQPATGPPARGPGRRSLETALLVISIVALAFNLRAAITSLPPIFPELEQRLGLSPATMTVLAATPVLCFGAVSGLAAWLSRRLGEERVLFGALILVSAGLLLRGALPGTMLFPGTIVACGAIAIMNVLLASMIKRRWPARAGLLIGMYLTSLSTGAVIASLISVPLYDTTGGSVQVTLGLWGLPAVAATLIWITQLRYRRRVPRPPAQPRTGPGRPRAHVHRHALAWQVTAFMGLQSLLYYAAISWLPELFRDRGDSAAAAGTLAVGLLRASTGGWTVPVILLLLICGVELTVGLFAGRAKLLPVSEARETTETTEASEATGTGSTLVSRSPAEQTLPVDGTQADNYSKLPAAAMSWPNPRAGCAKRHRWNL